MTFLRKMLKNNSADHIIEMAPDNWLSWPQFTKHKHKHSHVDYEFDSSNEVMTQSPSGVRPIKVVIMPRSLEVQYQLRICLHHCLCTYAAVHCQISGKLTPNAPICDPVRSDVPFWLPQIHTLAQELTCNTRTIWMWTIAYLKYINQWGFHTPMPPVHEVRGTTNPRITVTPMLQALVIIHV